MSFLCSKLFHTYSLLIEKLSTYVLITFIKTFVEKYRKVQSIKKTLTKKLVSHEVAGGGHDPSTSGLWIRRSNQLSYPAIQAIDFSFAGAKVIHLFELNKFFRRNFQKKMFFLISHRIHHLFSPIINIKKRKMKRFLFFCVTFALWNSMHFIPIHG